MLESLIVLLINMDFWLLSSPSGQDLSEEVLGLSFLSKPVGDPLYGQVGGTHLPHLVFYN